VGHLHLKSAGYKLAAVPEAAGCLHSHYVYGTGNGAHNPAGNVIHSFKGHNALVLKKWGKYNGLRVKNGMGFGF
jgi:hypothetical protein